MNNLLLPWGYLAIMWVCIGGMWGGVKWLKHRYEQEGIPYDVYCKEKIYVFGEGVAEAYSMVGAIVTLLVSSIEIESMLGIQLPPVSLWIAAPVLYALAIGDFLLTRHALSLGAREVNPFARFAMAKMGINKFPFISLGAVSVILVFVWTRSSIGAQYVLLVIWTGVLVHNKHQLQKYLQRAGGKNHDNKS